MQNWLNKARSYLAAALTFSLLLAYVASGMATKGFGYFVLLFIAGLIFTGGGLLLYAAYKGAERQGGTFRLLQLAYWLAAFSLFCYYMQIDFFWTKLAGENAQGTAERLRQIIQIVYFSGFAVALISLLVATAVKTEARHAQSAVLTLGGLLLFLVSLNYWSHIRPAAVDMTMMRKFSLSPESRELLKGIEGEVRITAFYSQNFFSDLYRDTDLLLRDAVSANSKISYTFVDPLREKELADQKGVDRIGTILVERPDGNEVEKQGEAGGKKQRAKNSTTFEILDEDGIKRFERELISNIVHVAGKKRNIYYSQGHEEKSVSGNFKDDTIATFDENLRALRHHLKQLSPAEGFPVKMPQADLVLVLGPRRDFTPAEKATLKKYFEDGGKLLIALDPESAADFSCLLSPLKVKYARERVHSDMALPPGKTTLQSMNYSEHAITAPFVKRPEERKLTIFPGAGYFETSNDTTALSAADYDVNYFLLSHFTSWIDKIPNGVRDDKKEPIASFKIGLAAKSKKNAGRLIFVADSDFLVNKFIYMHQNMELAARMIGWLIEDEKLTGVVAGKYDDEKVKLTGIKDTLVFHLFLYIYPGLILLTGFFIVRAKRRRMSDRAGSH